MPPRLKKTTAAAAASASGSAASKSSSSTKKKQTIAASKKVTPASPVPQSRGTKRKSKQHAEEEEEEEEEETSSSKAKSKAASNSKSSNVASSANKRARNASAKDVKSTTKPVDVSEEEEEEEEEEDGAMDEAATDGTPMSPEEAKEASQVWVSRLARMTPGSAQAAKVLKDFADPLLLAKLHWYTRGPKQRTLLLEFTRVYLLSSSEGVLPEPYEPEVWKAIEAGVTSQGYDLSTVLDGPSKENSLHLLFRATPMWAATAASAAAFRGIVTYLSEQGKCFIEMLDKRNQSRQIPWTYLYNGTSAQDRKAANDINAVIVLVSRGTAQAQKKEWTTFLREQQVLLKSVTVTVGLLQIMTVDELKWLRLEAYEHYYDRFIGPNCVYRVAVERVMNSTSTLSRLFLHVIDVLCVWQCSVRDADETDNKAAASASSSSSAAVTTLADPRSKYEPMGPPSSALFPPINYLPVSKNARDRARPTPPKDIHQWLRQFQEEMKTQLIAEDILKLFNLNTEAHYKQALTLLQETLDASDKPLAFLTSLPNSKSFFLLELLRVELPTAQLKKQLATMFPAILARADELSSNMRFGSEVLITTCSDKRCPSLLARVLNQLLPTAKDTDTLLTRFVTHEVRAYAAKYRSINMNAIFKAVLAAASGTSFKTTTAEIVVQLVPVFELFQTLGLELEAYGSVCSVSPELLSWWLLGEGKRFSMISTFPALEYVQPGYFNGKAREMSIIQQAKEQWNRDYLPQLRSMLEVHLIPDLTNLVLKHAMP